MSRLNPNLKILKLIEPKIKTKFPKLAFLKRRNSYQLNKFKFSIKKEHHESKTSPQEKTTTISS